MTDVAAPDPSPSRDRDLAGDERDPAGAPGSSTSRLVASLAWAWAGVAAALLGAMWLASTGPTYLVPIEGYDPRHPVAGHYLAFNYRWNVPERDPDEPVFLQLGFDPDAPPSCLCFPDPASGDVDPEVRVVPCGDVAACFASVSVDAAMGGARFYVPEADAPMLDELIRTRAAAVRVRVLPIGRLVPVELFFVEAPTPMDPDSLLPIRADVELRAQQLRPWRELR
jgi:hypothetical protein